jgi:hypothetical protein
MRRMRNKAKLLYSCATFHETKSTSTLRIICRSHHPSDNQHLFPFILLSTILFSLCLDGKVTDVTGHLLDAGERRAGDLVAAEAGVDVDHDAGL